MSDTLMPAEPSQPAAGVVPAPRPERVWTVLLAFVLLIGGALFSLLGGRPATVRRTGGIRLPVRFARS